MKFEQDSDLREARHPSHGPTCGHGRDLEGGSTRLSRGLHRHCRRPESSPWRGCTIPEIIPRWLLFNKFNTVNGKPPGPAGCFQPEAVCLPVPVRRLIRPMARSCCILFTSNLGFWPTTVLCRFKYHLREVTPVSRARTQRLVVCTAGECSGVASNLPSVELPLRTTYHWQARAAIRLTATSSSYQRP